MQEQKKLCRLCGRADNGSPKCRDHGEKRVFVKLDKEAKADE